MYRIRHTHTHNIIIDNKHHDITFIDFHYHSHPNLDPHNAPDTNQSNIVQQPTLCVHVTIVLDKFDNCMMFTSLTVVSGKFDNDFLCMTV